MGEARGLVARFDVMAIVATGLALVVCGVLAGSSKANNPFENEPAAQAIQFAESNWPDEFAGAWFDFDHPRSPDDFDQGWLPDQKVFFAFTHGAEEKVANLRSLFPASNPYVAVTHTHSYATLRQLQNEVTNDLRAYMNGELTIPGPAFRWYSTGVWVVGNEVSVSLSVVTPEYEAWAAERYGDLYPAINAHVGQKVVPAIGQPLRPPVSGRNEAGNGRKCGRVCRRALARKRMLKRKCARAARVAVRTGAPKAKRVARSKRCRALRR